MDYNEGVCSEVIDFPKLYWYSGMVFLSSVST